MGETYNAFGRASIEGYEERQYRLGMWENGST
jgi:hypothetical protein